MGELITRLARATRAFLDEPAVAVAPEQPVRVCVYVPEANPLGDGEGAEARAKAAMRMTDDDCYGFFLLTVHRNDEVTLEMELRQHLDDSWWSSVCIALEHAVAIGREP